MDALVEASGPPHSGPSISQRRHGGLRGAGGLKEGREPEGAGGWCAVGGRACIGASRPGEDGGKRKRKEAGGGDSLGKVGRSCLNLNWFFTGCWKMFFVAWASESMKLSLRQMLSTKCCNSKHASMK